MRANRLYHLIVSREGLEPAFLADPQRVDRIEVVSIDDGEVLLYWELPPKQAARLIKQLRADLARMEAAAFVTRWEGADGTGDWPL